MSEILAADNYSVNVQTVQATSIKVLFDSLKDILTDVNIHFTSSGTMWIKAMDSSHVALIYLCLESENFETFYVSAPDIVCGVNMTSLSKLIKTITPQDTVSFKMRGTANDKLEICISNSAKNSQSISILNLLDINEDTYEVPDVKYNSVIKIPASDFQKNCRDLSSIGETVKITSKSDEICFEVKGDFASQCIKVGVSGGGIIQSVHEGKDVSEEFSLKYLNMFTKSTNLGSIVELYFAKNRPMIALYKVGNLGRIQYALAPKISEDDLM
tara:strand:+ start:1254 stop:2066 length:813 start_codon:yes stop_codon:yes gene_type:complete